MTDVPLMYRKKPIVVEAVQWFKMGDHPAVIKVGAGFDGDGQVHGKQGWVSVHAGDWIIAEQDGSGFYPCEPDIFAATYEPIVEGGDANPEVIWTEGVCGDGAVLIRDGEPVTISDVLDYLNEAEQMRIERIQLLFACGYPMPAEFEKFIIPRNPFKCGICDARNRQQ